MMFWRVWIVVLVFAISAIFSNVANAQVKELELFPNCWVSEKEAGYVYCDLLFYRGTGATKDSSELERISPSEFSVQWANGKVEDFVVENYNPIKHKTSWLVLLDRSKSMTRSDIAQIKAFFPIVVNYLRGKEVMGVATFAKNLRLTARIGADEGDVIDAITDLKHDGQQTLLFKSVREGMEILKEQSDADRKILLVVTDGKAEDPRDSVGVRDLIEKAEKENLIVNVFYVGKSPEFSLDNLVDATQGVIRVPDDGLSAAASAGYLVGKMSSGGFAKFPRRDPGNEFNITLNVKMDDGSVVSEAVRIKTDSPWYYSFFSENRQTVIFSVVGLVALLLLGLAFLLLRPSSSPAPRPAAAGIGGGGNPLAGSIGPSTKPASAIGPTAGAGSSSVGGLIGSSDDPTQKLGSSGRAQTLTAQSYGWFDVIGKSNERIAITQKSMRIGRDANNDIRLDDKTVHRQHAVLHVQPDGKVILTDLSGSDGNGIIVNSSRVEKSELKNSDTIELGEVRLRFQEA